MAYTGKKPTDHTDVTQSQSMTVTDDLTVDTNTLHVDSTNNRVGIGSSAPDKTLVVSSTSGTEIVINDSDATPKPILRFRESGITSSTISTSSNNLIFSMPTTERMRIDSSGNVLVGTTNDNFNTGLSGARLMAAGHIISRSDNINYFLKEGTGTLQEFRYFSSGTATSGTTVGKIVITTSSTSYNTSSDYRLKENVTGITDGIERVKQLNPSRFNFIADADTTVDGFLAHEAQTVVPEAVHGIHNEVDDDGNPVYQGIDQAKLVPLLTAALQEAITKIETLEIKVAALEAAD